MHSCSQTCSHAQRLLVGGRNGLGTHSCSYAQRLVGGTGWVHTAAVTHKGWWEERVGYTQLLSDLQSRRMVGGRRGWVHTAAVQSTVTSKGWRFGCAVWGGGLCTAAVMVCVCVCVGEAGNGRGVNTVILCVPLGEEGGAENPSHGRPGLGEAV